VAGEGGEETRQDEAEPICTFFIHVNPASYIVLMRMQKKTRWKHGGGRKNERGGRENGKGEPTGQCISG